MKRVILAILAVASVAHAGDKDKADSLFKHGKRLMEEKKYAEACEKFEESMKLDPQIGTELNVGRCYEEWGKLGRAFKSYKAAEKMAKDASDTRATKIDELVQQLDAQVPRLTLHVPADADTSSVTLDGAPVESFTDAIVVDPGPHKVAYTNADGAKKSKVVPIERGGSSEINLDLPLKTKPKEKGVVDVVGPKGPPFTQPLGARSDPGRGYRLGAYALGGAGVVAIGVSTYLTVSAKSKYNDALKSHCGGMTNGCDDIGLKDTHDARHQANLATGVFVGGAVAIAGGVVLYLLAPKAEKRDEAAYIVPSVSPDSAGVVFGGSF
jgi:tetratricopeptide (TPR) repeat protein